MRPSSQHSTPSTGSDLARRRAASAIAGPSMVLGTTVQPARYLRSHVGSATWNRWTRNRVLIERSKYSRYGRMPVAISSNDGSLTEHLLSFPFLVVDRDPAGGVAQQRRRHQRGDDRDEHDDRVRGGVQHAELEPDRRDDHLDHAASVQPRTD